MHNYNYEIGHRIASIRKLNNVTQEKLAEILDISVKHCSEVERGISMLSLDKLIFFSEYFKCNLDYLLKGISIDENLISFFPKDIIEILSSNDESEKKILLEYIQMYLKLRKSIE